MSDFGTSKTKYSLLLLLLFLGERIALGQLPLELTKKSIRSYLFHNLNDFKSYEPIEYSELQKVYSQLRENPEYMKYTEIFEKNSIEHEELKLRMNELSNEISDSEKKLGELNLEIVKSNKKTVNTDSIYNVKQIEDIQKEIEDIKLNRPIPGKEYLSQIPKWSIWLPQNIFIYQQRKKIEMYKSMELDHLALILEQVKSDTIYLEFENIEKGRIRRINKIIEEIKLIEKQLVNNHKNLIELNATYTKNESTLSENKEMLSGLELTFKSVHIGFYICHRLRAKNSLGALVVGTKCFVLDNEYKIINVVDN